MLNQLNEQWGPQLLAFMAELPRQTPNFPKYILQLISKHFNFSRSLIFPYTYQAVDIEKRNRRDALNNFVTLNIESRLVKEYGTKVYKVDIFSPKYLPPNLQDQKVLFTYDVLPEKKYKKTEYYQYMEKQGLEKQACIYLRLKNEIIANICIFRSRNEPDFTDDERLLMEYLSDVISAQYLISLRQTGDVLSQDGFHMFFRNNKVGAIMLNSRLTVLMANSSAEGYSKTLLTIFKNEQDTLTRSNYQRNPSYNNVQQIMDQIGLNLVNSEAGMTTMNSLLEDFHFSYCPIIFVNIFGDVETRHLILVFSIKKSVTEEFNKAYGALTQRELEILKLVVEGEKNDRIAEKLCVSKFTVRTHISNIYQKFNVGSRVELMMKVNKGIFTDDQDRMK